LACYGPSVPTACIEKYYICDDMMNGIPFDLSLILLADALGVTFIRR